MKSLKNGCLIAFFLVFGLSAQAQVLLGARGGATLSKTTGNGFIENFTGQLNYIVSGNAAIFLKIPLARGLSFRPELGYVQSGAGVNLGTSLRVVGVDMPIGGSVRQRMTYVQAPLLLEYEFGQPQSAVKPYLIAGPAVGYLADNKLVSRANLLLFRTQPVRVDVGLGMFNRLEVSGVVGGGLSFDVGASKLFVEGRYQRGFTRVYDLPVVQLPVHNQSFSVLVGFAVPLGR